MTGEFNNKSFTRRNFFKFQFLLEKCKQEKYMDVQNRKRYFSNARNKNIGSHRVFVKII